MGHLFKHIPDVKVVKEILNGWFTKIEELDEPHYGHEPNQVGKTIRIEDTYDLTPYKSTETIPTIAGDRERECVAWDVVTYDYNAGVRYYPDGSGEPPSWDDRELGHNLSLPDAIKLIIQDWSKNMIDNSLESLYYDNETIEEEVNPHEW